MLLWIFLSEPVHGLVGLSLINQHSGQLPLKLEGFFSDVVFANNFLHAEMKLAEKGKIQTEMAMQ